MLPAAIVTAFDAEISAVRVRDALLSEIAADYAAPERHYHNLRHLEHLVSELESVGDAVADWNLLMLAAAYHDVVYDPARPDNEEASAVRAGTELEAFLDNGRLRKLEEIIIATKHHEAATDPDINLFCDADLAILGAAPEVYDIYASSIRKEYGHYPDELYNPGRISVLAKLLLQPTIFKSRILQQRYEIAARVNIVREIAFIQS